MNKVVVHHLLVRVDHGRKIKVDITPEAHSQPILGLKTTSAAEKVCIDKYLDQLFLKLFDRHILKQSVDLSS